jgi:hypothetical protein
LRQDAAVGEIGVDEFGIPGEIVVDGMVGIGVVLAAVADVQGRDAGVIEEGSVVGTISEGANG